MKAIVCDKCGKVNLLEDDMPYCYPSGVYRLINEKGCSDELDLCEDCANGIIEAVRNAGVKQC